MENPIQTVDPNELISGLRQVLRWRAGIVLLCVAGLGACAGPMALREAQTRAQERMTRFCAGGCGALHLIHSQKIKDRWLIDFDSPARRYTVLVDDGGNTQISIWDKSREASGQ